jgi:hypothetical protein
MRCLHGQRPRKDYKNMLMERSKKQYGVQLVLRGMTRVVALQAPSALVVAAFGNFIETQTPHGGLPTATDQFPASLSRLRVRVWCACLS